MVPDELGIMAEARIKAAHAVAYGDLFALAHERIASGSLERNSMRSRRSRSGMIYGMFGTTSSRVPNTRPGRPISHPRRLQPAILNAGHASNKLTPVPFQTERPLRRNLRPSVNRINPLADKSIAAGSGVEVKLESRYASTIR